MHTGRVEAKIVALQLAHLKLNSKLLNIVVAQHG
jgi:hypothetical protein